MILSSLEPAINTIYDEMHGYKSNITDMGIYYDDNDDYYYMIIFYVHGNYIYNRLT